jgi:hypothetical protein
MLSFITVIKRGGEDPNGFFYTEEALRKIVELGNEKEDGIPGLLGQNQSITVDPKRVKFRTSDLIYEEGKNRIRAHIEMTDTDPEFEKFILELLKGRNIKFGPCVVADLTEGKTIRKVNDLVSIDLILNEGCEEWSEVKERSRKNSSDSNPE